MQPLSQICRNCGKGYTTSDAFDYYDLYCEECREYIKKRDEDLLQEIKGSEDDM